MNTKPGVEWVKMEGKQPSSESINYSEKKYQISAMISRARISLQRVLCYPQNMGPS